nr:hypothetical protein [Tanacetum cinerariifolium]
MVMVMVFNGVCSYRKFYVVKVRIWLRPSMEIMVFNGVLCSKGKDLVKAFNGNQVRKGSFKPVYQLDVKNAFLHGDSYETVYMHWPHGFRDSTHPGYVCLLQRARMVHYNHGRTPIDTKSKLGVDGDSVFDPTLYRSLVGAIQYLTFTRPDISYAVQHVCLYMHDPREPYFSALKPILSVEAGYRGVANGVAEICWLRILLRELHTHLSFATLVYCDNVSAVYLSSNLVQRHCTKHIKIDIHFVRDLVDAGEVRVLHVPSRYQYADIFTKGLSSALSEEPRTGLSVRCPPAQTAREC